MGSPTRYTFLIAGALVGGAVFPLLGVMLGCVIAGMGLHACLSTGPRNAADIDALQREILESSKQRSNLLSEGLEDASLNNADRSRWKRK